MGPSAQILSLVRGWADLCLTLCAGVGVLFMFDSAYSAAWALRETIRSTTVCHLIVFSHWGLIQRHASVESDASNGHALKPIDVHRNIPAIPQGNENSACLDMHFETRVNMPGRSMIWQHITNPADSC